ncbi:MAG: hypothetical protein KDD52_00115 [Bdellovibrionales bacterium]|nr:hypothetical protein [Bdellovibrionales bacterium]
MIAKAWDLGPWHDTMEMQMKQSGTIHMIMTFLVLSCFQGAYAKTPAEEAKIEKMLNELLQSTGNKPLLAKELKERAGFSTRTYRFRVGTNEYRVVIDSEGRCTVGVKTPDQLVSSHLWSGSWSSLSSDRLTELIFSFEGLVPGQKNNPADQRDQIIREQKSLGDLLEWNRLMDQAMSGEQNPVAGGGGSGSSGMDRAVSMAKMMNSCTPSGGSLAPARAAVENLAQLMVAASSNVHMSADGGLGWIGKSRQYEKKGSYSFLQELESFEALPPNQVMGYVSESKIDFEHLFFESLQKTDQSGGPWSRAANKNFSNLMTLLGRRKTQSLLEQTVSHIVVNVDHFVRLEHFFPEQPVIFDVASKKIYIHPAASSPDEVKYLVSLAMVYVQKEKDGSLRRAIERLNKEKKRGQLSPSSIKNAFTVYENLEVGIAYP